jgi:hypothetical protein
VDCAVNGVVMGVVAVMILPVLSDDADGGPSR